MCADETTNEVLFERGVRLMAGCALGTPCRVLLPDFKIDWRWSTRCGGGWN